jgi:hypothetical protein
VSVVTGDVRRGEQCVHVNWTRPQRTAAVLFARGASFFQSELGPARSPKSLFIIAFVHSNDLSLL